jgi:hypothetical protein
MPAPSTQPFPPDYWIFDKLWWCRVPFNQSRSVDHIKQFGTPMSGDPERDRGTANELVDRMITIERMVEYWKAGVQVYVKNRAETKNIYEAISTYLQIWKNHLENSLNVGDSPLQDLVDLDQFANVVYSHAKYQLSSTFVEDVMARRVSSVLKVARGDMFVKKTVEFKADDTRTDEERLAEQFPDRSSDIGSTFAQRLQGGSINRGLTPKPFNSVSLNPGAANAEPSRVPGFADKWK